MANDQDASSDQRQQLVDRILECGVHVSGRITSRRGHPQNWLVDLRTVLLSPQLLQSICSWFWDLHADINEIHIAGMETAAIPIVTGLVLEASRRGKNVTGLMVRKKRKKTGLGRLIEGEIRFRTAIIVDDLMNSGRSLEKCRVALRRSAVAVHSAFVVVNYQSSTGRRWMDERNISVVSLITLEDLGLTLSQENSSKASVTFRPLWHFVAPGGFSYYTVPKSAPLFADGNLYFGSDSGTVWCISADTGEIRWQRALPACGRKGIWSSAALSEGKLYIGAYNGTLYCLDASSGSSVWEAALCEWIGSSPLVVPEHGLVFVGLEYARPRAQGSICALSAHSGEKTWEKLLRVFQHGSGAYSSRYDFVVFGTNDHNVIALDAESGRISWRFDTRRSVKYAPAICDERDLVAFASFDGSIYILRLSDGFKLAEIETGSICYTTPLFRGNRLYCGSGDKHVYIIDLDDLKLVGRLDAGARVFSSPRTVGGNVIYGTCGGIVREIDAATLELQGELTVPDGVSNAICVDPCGNRIFVPTVMNEIYAFDRVLL